MTATRSPRTVDALVAAVCWLFACGVLFALPQIDAGEPAALLEEPGTLAWWLTLLTLTVQAVALSRARTSPRASLLVVAGVPVVLAVAGPGPVYSLTGLTTVVTVFLVTLVLPAPTLRVALPVTALLVFAGEALNASSAGSDTLLVVLASAALQGFSVVGLPCVVALAVAARREARTAHRGEEQALVRERDALVQAAVADERTAMARELHDIAAHHMSGIAIMSAAIARQIDTDPEAAKRSVQQVREQSTAVLDDLRRLVGLLRHDDGEATRSVETLAALRDLVDDRRIAGLDVELRVSETPGRQLGEGVGPLAQLVVFRMVQEGLANAAMHAPGAACVIEVDDRGESALVVRVRNDAPSQPSTRTGASPGFGLLGMGERAALVGAHLAYGSTVDGGWEVRLTLPRDTTHPPRTTTDPEPGDPA